mmetsp:Transcript_20057/g.50606  ORF Transcript_20057/g.50606 Transcript_20057/m.50606 type:complete len:506 (+) Transcript_20057:3697-5214(+)
MQGHSISFLYLHTLAKTDFPTGTHLVHLQVVRVRVHRVQVEVVRGAHHGHLAFLQRQLLARGQPALAVAHSAVHEGDEGEGLLLLCGNRLGVAGSRVHVVGGLHLHRLRARGARHAFVLDRRFDRAVARRLVPDHQPPPAAVDMDRRLRVFHRELVPVQLLHPAAAQALLFLFTQQLLVGDGPPLVAEHVDRVRVGVLSERTGRSAGEVVVGVLLPLPLLEVREEVVFRSQHAAVCWHRFVHLHARQWPHLRLLALLGDALSRRALVVVHDLARDRLRARIHGVARRARRAEQVPAPIHSPVRHRHEGGARRHREGGARVCANRRGRSRGRRVHRVHRGVTHGLQNHVPLPGQLPPHGREVGHEAGVGGRHEQLPVVRVPRVRSSSGSSGSRSSSRAVRPGDAARGTLRSVRHGGVQRRVRLHAAALFLVHANRLVVLVVRRAPVRVARVLRVLVHLQLLQVLPRRVRRGRQHVARRALETALVVFVVIVGLFQLPSFERLELNL